jgi:hypothetical protein
MYIHSLTSALDEYGLSASRPGRFTHRERAPGTHWIRGWVGPRAVLDAGVKRKIPRPGIQPPYSRMGLLPSVSHHLLPGLTMGGAIPPFRVRLHGVVLS